MIGGGAVGLAIARRTARSGKRFVGAHLSSRNSEVIHAGDPAGSLKARLGLAGRDALDTFCAERKIRHSGLGKLVVRWWRQHGVGA
ncbi:MAG TPA: FAD-dependent oxidoreductase [Myxococcaceae bacterium]